MGMVDVNPELEKRRIMLRIKEHETKIERWEVDILTKEDEIKRTRVNIDSTLAAIIECEQELSEWESRCASIDGESVADGGE